MKKRILVGLLVAVLLIGCSITGTMAWLQAESNTVVNTFTYGDINITLDETKVDESGDPITDAEGNTIRTTEGNTYKMIPGSTITKDPIVTVKAGSEACYLFIKVDEQGGAAPYGFADYLTYTLADGWNQLNDTDGAAVSGVYYREVEKDTDGQPAVYPVIKDNTVKVKMSVSKEMLNALDAAGIGNYPKLSITAYAVQQDNIPSAAQAWAEITAEG